jgi:hypothetical protein
MYKAMTVLVIAMMACGGTGETTPAGAVGATLDLRSRISKPEIRAKAPADDKAMKQEYAVDVHGVKAKIVWRTFEDSGTKYIVSVGWEVVTPAKGITLEPLGTLNPENAGTVAAPVQSEIIRVRWHDNNSSVSTKYGEMSIRIDAEGKGAAT